MVVFPRNCPDYCRKSENSTSPPLPSLALSCDREVFPRDEEILEIFKFKGINCVDQSTLRPSLLIFLVVFPRNSPDYCKTFPKLFKQLYLPSPPFTRYCIKKEKKRKNRQSRNIMICKFWCQTIGRKKMKGVSF